MDNWKFNENKAKYSAQQVISCLQFCAGKSKGVVLTLRVADGWKKCLIDCYLR